MILLKHESIEKDVALDLADAYARLLEMYNDAENKVLILRASYESKLVHQQSEAENRVKDLVEERDSARATLQQLQMRKGRL